jgi:putative ABC transport system substrate-binding protein
MRRRDLLAVLGGTAGGWPLMARAQQAGSRVVGFLQSFKPPEGPFPSAYFREGLKDFGYAEGENIVFDARWTDNYEELPKLAAELVRRPVGVIVAFGHPSAVAAKAATAAIPIVFWTGADPVAQGLVASLAHPGGNLTGLGDLSTALGAKRLELIRELVPKARVFGFLINSTNPNAEAQSGSASHGGRPHGGVQASTFGTPQQRRGCQRRNHNRFLRLNNFVDRLLEQAAEAANVKTHVVSASAETEIETAFAALVNDHVDALIVAADPFIYNHREKVIELAAQNQVPAMYTVPAYVHLGGLINYTSRADTQETAFQLGRYTGRVLKGEKPADLPVIISTRFQMVINLKTAKALGLTVPQSLLAQANEVIE